MVTKCAEIHYQSASFSILCIRCDINIYDFDDFVLHFNDVHLDKTPSASLLSNHDPLELETEHSCAKNLRTQLRDTVKCLAIDVQDYLDNEMQNKNSDKDQRICKLNTDTSNSRQMRKICSKKYSPEIENAVTYHSNEIDDNACSKTLSKNFHAADQETDIDWTKPYVRNNVKRQYKPRNRPNICSYCGRTFQRRYQLDTHLNIHTGLKPHQCEICGRQFRAITTLTRHLNTHENRDEYGCKFCGKAFTHKAALLSHELRHTQERHIPCSDCEKCFYTFNQMDTHKRKVHHKTDDAATLPFACDLCSKRYRSASMLSTHKFKKHYKSAKFSCEQCGKKFVDQPQLDKHKLIHIDGLLKLNCE